MNGLKEAGVCGGGGGRCVCELGRGKKWNLYSVMGNK